MTIRFAVTNYSLTESYPHLQNPIFVAFLKLIGASHFAAVQSSLVVELH